MKLILEVTNKSFNTAFALVARDHSHLFHHSVEFIKLVPKKRHVWADNWGLHKRMNQQKSQIFICNRRTSVPEFVNTLVHELTHVKQHVAFEFGQIKELIRRDMEDEAYYLGKMAELSYEGKF